MYLSAITFVCFLHFSSINSWYSNQTLVKCMILHFSCLYWLPDYLELSFFQEGHRVLGKLNSVLTGITCIKMMLTKKCYSVQCLHANKIYIFYCGLENFLLKISNTESLEMRCNYEMLGNIRREIVNEYWEEFK